MINQGSSWVCSSELAGLANLKTSVMKTLLNPLDHPLAGLFWKGSCEVGQLTAKGNSNIF